MVYTASIPYNDGAGQSFTFSQATTVQNTQEHNHNIGWELFVRRFRNCVVFNIFIRSANWLYSGETAFKHWDQFFTHNNNFNQNIRTNILCSVLCTTLVRAWPNRVTAATGSLWKSLCIFCHTFEFYCLACVEHIINFISIRWHFSNELNKLHAPRSGLSGMQRSKNEEQNGWWKEMNDGDKPWIT